MENKVLSLEELNALPDGTQVWLEMRMQLDKCFSGWYTKYGQELKLHETDNFPFTIGGKGHMAMRFRAWVDSPTEKDTAAWPWEKPVWSD